MKLREKVALVSGGARVIGHAVSVKLAREGAKVALNYYASEEQAQATVNAIKEAGGEAIAIGGDMT